MGQMSEISIIAQNMKEADLNPILDYLEMRIDSRILNLRFAKLDVKQQEAKLDTINRLYYYYQLIQTEFW